MKISKITNWLVAGAACLLLGTSCDVDPTFLFAGCSRHVLYECRRGLVAFLIVLLRIGVGG